MNDRLVLAEARRMCGEDRHEDVLRNSYKKMRRKDIDDDVLASHVNKMKNGKVPDHLADFIKKQAKTDSTIVTRMPRERRGQSRRFA